MIKQKPCKGQDEAHGFDGCGKLVNVENRKFGLGKNCCFPEWLYDTERGKLYLNRAMTIGKKQTETKIKKQVIASKENHEKAKKEAKKWDKELQTVINEIARLIDFGLGCLARNYIPEQMHGGHVYARGGNKTIAYNLHNIHRQSAQSNHFGNDDGLLREGVANEYGQHYLDFISGLRQIPSLNYSNKEYHEFYKKACKVRNQLKKNPTQNLLINRIKLRNVINKELGIYPDEWCCYLKPL